MQTVKLPDMVLPGQSATMLLPIDLPSDLDSGRIQLRSGDRECSIPLSVDGGETVLAGGIAPLLDAVQLALAQAHARQTLPRDYLDVCEGRFARVKRWVKNKVLNNFKRAYVDVMSSQQSDVNRRLVESVQQLSECCRALDQTVRVLQNRVAELSASGECRADPNELSSIEK